jgi:hypothetical protein
MMAGKGNFQYRMQQWMMGRNGSDDLGRACLWTAIVLMLASLVAGFATAYAANVLSWLAFIFIVYSFFRMMSKNTAARQKENRAWVKQWTKIVTPLRRFRSRCAEWKKYHKEYRIYTCEKCGQSLRVPKGKGKVKVTCPKCKASFVKKS